MGVVRGCNFPDELYYNIENNVWARREPDGTVTVGMTSYACSLSGEVVAFTPKKIGKAVEKDKSCATVESGKWVGPVKAPIGGEIVAVNEAAEARPATINQDPYGQGWVARLKPANADAELAALKTGAAAHAAYEAKMAADQFTGC